MVNIVTREAGPTAKGSPLTNAELDANFSNLNNGKEENITPGTAAQVWIGTKVWTSVLTLVQNTLLTGFVAGSNVAIAATDSLIDALEKLQGQINAKQATLGYTAESTANKGVANGYAGLDGTGKVSAIHLPSYVDDVLEYAALASFPATGESGKIYIDLATNKTYRWSGSAYVVITASPGSTDAVPEGSSNLYHTAARVLATTLSGLSLATATTIATADSVLIALGKLQGQMNAKAPLTGAGTSGTWGISVTGNAGSADTIRSTFVTSNTGGSYSNQYTKFLTITIPSRYGDYDANLRLLSYANGSQPSRNSDLYIRVKQQNDFGSNPSVDVDHLTDDGDYAGIGYVITSNAGPTVVDFYIKNTAGWNVIAGFLFYKTGSGGTGVFLSAQGFSASVAGIVDVTTTRMFSDKYKPTADALTTARSINGVGFDGTANITVADSTKVPLSGGNLTGDLIYQNIAVGGWARGLAAKIQSTAAYAAGIGFLGTSDSFSTAYIGVGESPWSSGNGVRVTAAGVTISGATTFDTLITGSVNGNAATATTLTGLTPTVAELNYVDGVTSAIQTQLNGKAASSHTHSYAPLTGAGTSGSWPISITGSAASASAVAWSGVSGKPTTLAGYGITNGYAMDGVNTGWFRSSGATGWYNETYGGGIYMSDATYVRTFSGKSFLCNSVMRVEGPQPQVQLWDSDHSILRYLYADGGNIGFLTSAGGWALTNDNSGNTTSTGNLTAYSDIRLKKNIELIPDALAKVVALRGVTYERIDTGQRQTGVIAQEVQAVLPEAVMTMTDEQQTLSVAYGNLVGLLIEAIKELKAEVDALKQGAK